MKLLILGIALALLYSGAAYSQGVPFEGCCQLFTGCENLSQSACLENPNSFEFVMDELCDTSTGRCPGLPLGDSEGSDALNVPTLTEWGMIVMAGILGIVSFTLIRRRKDAS